ncbi:MAG: lytic transglycosylase domain-containing protein [Dactylosporangium sp.]|nr:lytic transglycosylase domain-containing protein [Dactylosporangium sp.]NNJ60122.1 lytic transglycosylase domain-containing protein [Dactylosporangium sp.]
MHDQDGGDEQLNELGPQRSEPAEGVGYRHGAWFLGGLAVVTITVLISAAVLLLSGEESVPVGLAASDRAGPTAGEYQLPSPTPEEPSPSPSPSSAAPSPSAAPSRAPSAQRSIVPSKRPVTEPVAPAPAATPAPGACPTYPGPTSTKVQVRVQLEASARYTYWQTSAPSLRVPLVLLKAVAWQESGWQSAIVACDGGIGTMQVMPNTATWINTRFGTSWDVDAVDGNIMLGGQYLAWLIKYMGDVYYGGLYDVTADDGLLNSVIAGYNVGAGAVDPTAGDAGIPNWSYVHNVRALMRSCPCSAY